MRILESWVGGKKNGLDPACAQNETGNGFTGRELLNFRDSGKISEWKLIPVPVPGSEFVEPSWDHQRESRMYKSPTRDPQDHVSGSLVEIIPHFFFTDT